MVRVKRNHPPSIYQMQESRENREKLQRLLKDLFQFDAADLDFGIYRVLNQRRDRIEQFIEKDLPQIVEDTLDDLEAEDREELEKEVKQKRQELTNNLEEDAVKPNGEVKEEYQGTSLAQDYQDARERLEQAKTSDEIAAHIFNDVYRFFSRYYDEGDFVAQRRHTSQDSKYCVPYDGQEVLFHWANKDQYYVKSSLHFNNYVFDTEDLKVEFIVTDAEEPTDNVKGEDRYFVLAEDPIEKEDNKLKIHFEHRQITEEEADSIVDEYNEVTGDDKKSFNRSTNTKLCTALESRILSRLGDEDTKEQLEEEEGGKTLLRKHLERFTSENDQDYFIHKDLEGFLNRELDVFLKTELLNTEDLLHSDTPGSEPPMLRARAVRRIAEKIIEFLAKIEEFQKRLFEKKKFIYQTDYMVTIDKVPKSLWEEILENEEQIEQWKDVYSIDEWNNDLRWQGEFDEQFLENHPHLMIDTAFFDQEFKAELLASFEDIEEEQDGLLIHGENFQALNTLENRYRDKLDAVYIDPPYNAKSSEIIYKNKFKHSSWISMMNDRIRSARELLQDEGIFACSIDDYELENLNLALEKIFFPENWLSTCVVVHNPGGRQDDKFFPTAHEYITYYAKDKQKADINRLDPSEEKLEEYKYSDEWGNYKLRNFRRSGSNSRKQDRPGLWYPIYYDADSEELYLEEKEGTEKILPIDSNGIERCWRWGPETLEKRKEKYIEVKEKNEELKIYLKEREGDYEGEKAKTIWNKSEYSAVNGTYQLKNFFGQEKENLFSFPKSPYLMQDILKVISGKNSVILDFFAGSGTTAHKAVDLNREGGKREYIAIEMGDYFDDILRPRVVKAVFASDWEDGIPDRESEGVSHFVKYHRLESYEDSLNNVRMKEPEPGQVRLVDPEDEEYVINYMFDLEPEGSSLLTEDAFDTPFQYTIKIQGKGNMSKRGGDEQTGSLRSPVPENVDLVETFHYLLGAKVRQYWQKEHQGRRYVVTKCEVEKEHGTDDVLTVWRPTEDLDYEQEADWFAEAFSDQDVDTVYVNGESQIDNWKPLEPVFRERMEADTGGA